MNKEEIAKIKAFFTLAERRVTDADDSIERVRASFNKNVEPLLSREDLGKLQRWLQDIKMILSEYVVDTRRLHRAVAIGHGELREYTAEFTQQTALQSPPSKHKQSDSPSSQRSKRRKPTTGGEAYEAYLEKKATLSEGDSIDKAIYVAAIQELFACIKCGVTGPRAKDELEAYLVVWKDFSGAFPSGNIEGATYSDALAYAASILGGHC